MDLKIPSDEVFSEVQHCIVDVNYKVKDIISNEIIIAEGSRNFSWGITIVLVILLWPAAIVYYFTRQRSSVTITISENDVGCSITATSNGGSSEKLLDLIEDSLVSEEVD